MINKGFLLHFFLLWMFVPTWNNLYAQSDSTLNPPGSATLIEAPVKSSAHSPKKAALYSAILPGAGQVYNHKYWKLGVLAVGAGALIYSVKFNGNKYESYKSELIKRQQNFGGNDVDLEKYTDANLLELQKFYKRYKDLSIIGLVFLYVMNIVDASVDAHLMDFDIGDDLSLRIRPEPVYTSYHALPFPGLGLTFRF